MHAKAGLWHVWGICMLNGNEVLNLKKKCNLQLNKILELEEKIKNLEAMVAEREGHISQLEAQMEKTVGVLQAKGDAIEEATGAKMELFLFLETFFLVVQKILEDGAFIPYKNFTKNSASYCKIAKEIFEDYVRELSPIDLRSFLDYCIDLHFLKAEADRKCTYNNDKIRVYFVSRTLVRSLGGLGTDAATENLCG